MVTFPDKWIYFFKFIYSLTQLWCQSFIAFISLLTAKFLFVINFSDNL